MANAQSEKGDATTRAISADTSAPQTANVDQCLERLRDIAEHGNLADTQYPVLRGKAGRYHAEKRIRPDNCTEGSPDDIASYL